MGERITSLRAAAKDLYHNGKRIRSVRENSTLFDTAEVNRMNRVPIVYSDNRILLGREAAYTMHEIPLQSWGFLSAKQKQNYWHGATGFFSQSFPNNKNTGGHLLVTNSVYSADEWHANIIKAANENQYKRDSLHGYVDASKQCLDNDVFFDRSVYLFTQMGDRQDTKGALGLLYQAIRDLIVSAALDDAPPEVTEIQHWVDKAKSIDDTIQSSWMRAKHVGQHEIEWLYRHLDTPGLPTPALSFDILPDGYPAWATPEVREDHNRELESKGLNPEQHAIEQWGLGQWHTVLGSYVGVVDIGKSINKDEIRGVQFDSPTGTAYACYLPINHIPGRIGYNANWLHHSANLPFPVDASLHFQVLDPTATEKALERPIKAAENQAMEDQEAGANSDEANQENRAILSQVQKDTRRSKTPIVYWQCVLSVYDTTKDGLRQKVNELISHYKQGLQFELVCPGDDQRELFYQSLPGSSRLINDWIQITPPAYLAAAAPWLSANIGDSKGLYQGYTLTTDNQGNATKGSPFFYDIFNVVDDEIKAPTEVVAGFPGSGKTVSRGLKCVLEDGLKGVTQFVWDPKGDFRPLSQFAREMGLDPQKVNLIDLGDPKASISLDAFAVAEVSVDTENPEDSIDERGTLATRILTQLLKSYMSEGSGTAGWTSREVINNAVERVLRGERFDGGAPPSMLELMRTLERWSLKQWDQIDQINNGVDLPLIPNEDSVGEFGRSCQAMLSELRAVQKTKLGRLLFKQAQNGVRGMRITPGSMTIFIAMNMRMREEGEDENRETLISDIIGSLMTDYIRSLLSDKALKHKYKSATFDEWHAIKRNGGADGLLNWLRRIGRTGRCCVRQLSQSAGDFDNNSLTTAWCGRVENEDEAKMSCHLLGIEMSPNNIQRLLNLQTGEFLFRDSSGRVAWVQVDIWSEQLMDWFDTQAKSREARALREQNSARRGSDQPGAA